MGKKKKTAAPAEAPKPPGRISRLIRRRCMPAVRACRPYALTLAAIAAGWLVLRMAAPGWQWLALVAVGVVLGIGVDRWREHLGWHRSGGKAAMRRRRRFQGRAPLAEVARNLSCPGGVPIGTVRGSR